VACVSTSVIYGTIYIVLRRRSGTSSTPIPHGATPLMILYPTIYTVCTIPIAAGRIASMAGQDISLAYFCIAGSMIACNGWLDTLLYSLTRRSIVFCDTAGENVGIQTFWALGIASGLGTVTTIESGVSGAGRAKGVTQSSSSSTEHLYGMGIKVQATVDVRSEEAQTDDEAFEMRDQKRRKTNSRERFDKLGWESKIFEDL
jgi:hypothetical protein